MPIKLDKESKAGTGLAMPQLFGPFRVAPRRRERIAALAFLVLVGVECIAVAAGIVLIVIVIAIAIAAHDDYFICHTADNSTILR